MYSLIQSILNRYYDESIENNYSVMLVKIWRVYFEQYFNSVVAKVQGTEFIGGEPLAKLKEILKKVCFLLMSFLCIQIQLKGLLKLQYRTLKLKKLQFHCLIFSSN